VRLLCMGCTFQIMDFVPRMFPPRFEPQWFWANGVAVVGMASPLSSWVGHQQGGAMDLAVTLILIADNA
jgi:hypothetical protein